MSLKNNRLIYVYMCESTETTTPQTSKGTQPWTCEVCATTIRYYCKNQHCRSKIHIEACKIAGVSPAPPRLHNSGRKIKIQADIPRYQPNEEHVKLKAEKAEFLKTLCKVCKSGENLQDFSAQIGDKNITFKICKNSGCMRQASNKLKKLMC